jgi:hypothetical protein
MTLSITALGTRYCYAECQKAICRLCWVCHKCYTWPKILAKDKHSSLHWEHVFCSKTIWSTQLFWSTPALADTFLADKMIWPTLWPTHFLSDKIFRSTKCFTDTFWSTKCFGRHLFCRQNVLVDKIFWSTNYFTDTFLVDKMIWPTHFLSTKSFGRQNLLVDKIFWSTKSFGRQNLLVDKMIWPTTFFVQHNFVMD